MFHQLVLTGDLNSDIVTAEMQMWISLDFSQILAETLKTVSFLMHQNLLWVLKGWEFCCCGGFLVCLLGFLGFVVVLVLVVFPPFLILIRSSLPKLISLVLSGVTGLWGKLLFTLGIYYFITWY